MRVMFPYVTSAGLQNTCQGKSFSTLFKYGFTKITPVSNIHASLNASVTILPMLLYSKYWSKKRWDSFVICISFQEPFTVEKYGLAFMLAISDVSVSVQDFIMFNEISGDVS